MSVYTFYLGQQFVSFTELLDFVKNYQSEHSVKLRTHHSCTVESGRKKRRGTAIDDRLKYYQLRLQCIYGSKKGKNSGLHNTESLECFCPFFLYFRATKDGNALEIVNCDLRHNHTHQQLNKNDEKKSFLKTPLPLSPESPQQRVMEMSCSISPEQTHADNLEMDSPKQEIVETSYFNTPHQKVPDLSDLNDSLQRAHEMMFMGSSTQRPIKMELLDIPEENMLTVSIKQEMIVLPNRQNNEMGMDEVEPEVPIPPHQVMKIPKLIIKKCLTKKLKNSFRSSKQRKSRIQNFEPPVECTSSSSKKHRKTHHLVNRDDLLIIPSIEEKPWCLFDVFWHVRTPESTLQILVAFKLISNSYTCPQCENSCNIMKQSLALDDIIWNCYSCRITRSIRAGSIFTHSSASLSHSVILIYLWVQGASIEHAVNKTGLEEEFVVEWFNLLRQVCVHWCKLHPILLGGYTEEMETVEVQIDVTLLTFRGDTKWVFGAVETGTGRCVVSELPNCYPVSLYPLIEKYILPGSHILSDTWFSSIALHVLNAKRYRLTKLKFENSPVSTHSTTKLFSTLTETFKKYESCDEKLFHEYLDEFLWRANHPKNGFGKFLNAISEKYCL